MSNKHVKSTYYITIHYKSGNWNHRRELLPIKHQMLLMDFNTKQNSFVTSGHVKWYNHFWKKRCGHFLLTQMYPEDLPREMKTQVQKKTYNNNMHSSLIHNRKRQPGSSPDFPIQEWIKHWLFIKTIQKQQQPQMPWVTDTHEWISETLDWVKGASCKREFIVSLHLHAFLKSRNNLWQKWSGN